MGMLDSDDDLAEEFFKGGGKGKSNRRKNDVKMPTADIGLGWHSFTFSYNSVELRIILLLQRIGQPVAHRAEFFSSMVLFTEGSDQEPLLKLCQEASQEATEQRENQVSLWRFDTR